MVCDLSDALGAPQSAKRGIFGAVCSPVTVKERDANGRETGERRAFFKTAFVLGLSQTEPLPGVSTNIWHESLLAPLRSYGSRGFLARSAPKRAPRRSRWPRRGPRAAG